MTQLVNRDYYWKSGKVVLELAKCFKVGRLLVSLQPFGTLTT